MGHSSQRTYGLQKWDFRIIQNDKQPWDFWEIGFLEHWALGNGTLKPQDLGTSKIELRDHGTLGAWNSVTMGTYGIPIAPLWQLWDACVVLW